MAVNLCEPKALDESLEQMKEIASQFLVEAYIAEGGS